MWERCVVFFVGGITEVAFRGQTKTWAVQGSSTGIREVRNFLRGIALVSGPGSSIGETHEVYFSDRTLVEHEHVVAPDTSMHPAYADDVSDGIANAESQIESVAEWRKPFFEHAFSRFCSITIQAVGLLCVGIER